MAVAKRQEGKSPRKENRGRSKEGRRTGVRTSGRRALLPKASLHRTGPRGRKKIQKEEPKGFLSLSCAMGCSSLRIFGSTCPHASKMDFLAIF